VQQPQVSLASLLLVSSLSWSCAFRIGYWLTNRAAHIAAPDHQHALLQPACQAN
jgi:hypothetical protein